MPPTQSLHSLPIEHQKTSLLLLAFNVCTKWIHLRCLI